MTSNSPPFPPEDSLDLESSLFRHWYDAIFEPLHPVTCQRYRGLGYTREHIIECVINTEGEAYRTTLYINFLNFAVKQGYNLGETNGQG